MRWIYTGIRTVTEKAEVEIDADSEEGAKALGQHVVSEGGTWERVTESPVTIDSVKKA